MKGLISFDLLRLDGYMAMQTEEVDGKLYVDAILTEPRVERCRCEEPDVVKHGDVREDTTAYDYMSLTEEERAEVYGTRFGHGINLSTFENDLRAGAFW